MTGKSEIQNRLRKRFLDRLSTRIGRLRRELVERNWPVLRTECRQIKGGGESFGFEELTRLAQKAESCLPSDELPMAMPVPEAKQAVDELITAIDTLLIENSNRAS